MVPLFSVAWVPSAALCSRWAEKKWMKWDVISLLGMCAMNVAQECIVYLDIFATFMDFFCLTWICSEHLSFEQPSLSALLLFRSAVLGPRVLGLGSTLLLHSDPYREIIP